MVTRSASEIIHLNTLQRIGIFTGSAFGAFLNPQRDDLVAALLEVAGISRLRTLYRRMLALPEGRRVLTEKPLVSSATIPLTNLQSLPPNTFGYHYANWLIKENVTPDTRNPVRFIEDPELGYLVLRIRQCHDYFHVLLNMPTSIAGELALKIVEAEQFRLPGPSLAAVFGPLITICDSTERHNFKNIYFPVAMQNVNPNHKAKLMLSAYFEKRFQQDIEKLREEFNIIPYTGKPVDSKLV